MSPVRAASKRSVIGEKAGAGARHLVIIDQGPLRRTAAAECTDSMAQLEMARAGWHRFEREDKPAFIRWRAREFGALLSKAREVETQIQEHQALIHEVEMEMRRGFQDAHSAYQRVKFRRENPLAAGEESERDVDPRSRAEARNLTDFEKEALFQEWVQKSLGTNPDKMDDVAYSTTFEAFKSHMFRDAREELLQNVNRPSASARIAEEDDEVTEEETGTPVDARVKELYRRLVRRLHPDLRADGNAAVSALWHEVQEAYAASDVPRMEILLALSDIESDHMGDSTSLAQMRVVHAELQRALRALEKSLLEAESEDAWNFARRGPDEDLRLRLQRELKSSLAARMQRLDLLTRTIAAWEHGPIANRKFVHERQFAFQSG